MYDHLDRFRSAVDAIPADLNCDVSLNESLRSTANTDNESEQPSLQEAAKSAPSSEGSEPSKMRKLRSRVMLQQEIEYLKQQLAQEREESKEQLARQEDETKNRQLELLRCLKEQKEENKRLIDMLQQRRS